MDLIKQIICSDFHILSDSVCIESAPSGASSKKYYMVSGIAADRPNDCFRVMQASSDTFFDFLDVTRVFEKHNIRTPRIFHQNHHHTFVIMEDCGNCTLETAVTAVSQADIYDYYKRAIDLLLTIQTSAPMRSSIVSTRFFDKAKFVFEYDFHVREKLIQNYFKHRILDTDKKILDVLFDPIIQELSAQPFVMVHRDFQSSNLLLMNRELVIIDYQDARMGLALYDLVSLIEDVYVHLPLNLKSSLIEYYIDSALRLHIPIPSKDSFYWIYDLTTIQRKLHDAGAFAFCFENFANVKYLAYIDTVFQQALDVISRYTIFDSPYELLTMISHADRTKN